MVVSPSASLLEVRLVRYPEGTRVTVAYDPARPERSVLEPGTSWPAVIKKYVGAAVFALLGLGLAYVGVSGLRR